MRHAPPAQHLRLALRFAAALAGGWLGCATAPPSAPAALPAAATLVGPARTASSAEIEQLVSSLSLEEKVAQLVIAYAPPGTGPIRQGGVMLLGRALGDPSALRARVDALQRRAGLPLLVAVDLEGGDLNRLKALRTLSALPSAREMGEEGGWEAEAWGRRAGLDLASLGVNLSLGPVLDLASTGFMAETGRSLGDDPIRVARLGRAFARGLASAGVLAIGKHYPGYGPAEGSSDRALLLVDRSAQEIARHQAAFVSASASPSAPTAGSPPSSRPSWWPGPTSPGSSPSPTTWRCPRSSRPRAATPPSSGAVPSWPGTICCSPPLPASGPVCPIRGRCWSSWCAPAPS